MTHDGPFRGTRIADILEAQGIRQDWLARQSGISGAHLCRIIRGQRNASKPVAERIAGTLRVPFFVAFELPIGSEIVHDGASEELVA